MARRKKADEVVDGFTTLRAAQRAAEKGVHPHKTSQLEPVEVPKPPPGRESSAGTDGDAGKIRVGHTAKPTRHDIVCYECGFSFFLTGQLKSTYCPKCRSILDAAELTIKGEWCGTLKTIGLVTIASDGVVTEGARISANCVKLEGRIAGGKVGIFGRLYLCPGGVFVPEAVTLSELVVVSGASLKLAGELCLKGIEIAGEVHGMLRITGQAVVRSGGVMSGSLVGHHLVVEDGASMNATLAVTPTDASSVKQASGSPGNVAAAESNRRSAA